MNGWMVACIHAWMDRCVCKRKSHHQLQDALDVGLATQTLVHNVRFDIITKSSSAAGCRHLARLMMTLLYVKTHVVDKCLCCQVDV